MSKPHRIRRRAVILVVTATSVFGLAGVARALWSSSATGSGSAKTLTAQALTVTAAASPTADMYPGSTGALQLTVTNPNPYHVNLTSISYGTITSSNPSGCPISNLTAGAGGTLGTPISVNASATSGAVSIPAAVTLALSAPDTCQGVTFTVAVTFTGSQS